MPNKPIISLDLETSSSDPENGEILSIGMVDYQTGKYFYETITYEHLMVSPASMQIHGITMKEIDPRMHKDSKDLTTVMAHAAYFLCQCDPEVKPGGTLRSLFDLQRQFEAMGKNVGTFDLQFLKCKEGTLSPLFSYQAWDLNSMWKLDSDQLNKDFHEHKSTMHEHAKRATEIFLAQHPNYWEEGPIGQHHALYDVFYNCFAYSNLVGRRIDWMKG